MMGGFRVDAKRQQRSVRQTWLTSRVILIERLWSRCHKRRDQTGGKADIRWDTGDPEMIGRIHTTLIP
jgi:hypothetical protein